MTSELLAIEEKRDAEDSRDSDEQKLVKRAVRDALRHTNDAVDAIGGRTVAAGVCGYDRGDLRKALEGDNRISLEHTIAIGARVARYNPSLAAKLGAAIVRPFDLLVFPRVTISDAERAARLEIKLRAFASAAGRDADELVAEALGGRL